MAAALWAGSEAMTHDIRDKPLACGFKVPVETLDTVGLRTGDVMHDEARSMILGQLVHMRNKGDDRAISYSRRRAWYASPRGAYLRGTPLGFATITRSVDAFAEVGIIEHEKAEASVDGSGWQSRFRLRDAPDALPASVPVKQVGPTLILRDDDGLPLQLPNTDQVWRMQRQIDALNEALAHVVIGGVHVASNFVDCGDGRKLWLADLRLRRIFNGDFRHGGRAYAVYQQVPADIRATFTLNGAPVKGHDYKCLHAYLAYAEAGIVLAEGTDLYHLGEVAWSRDLIKRALNVMLNAQTPKAAMRAISGALAEVANDPRAAATKRGTKAARAVAWHQLCEGYGRNAQSLIDAIAARHRLIARAFGSGAGLRFQALDAQIILGVAGQLMCRKGVPCLTVHDEALVPEAAHGQLVDRMQSALGDCLKRLAGQQARPTRFLAETQALQGSEVPHSAPPAPLPPALPSALVPCPAPAVLPDAALGGANFWPISHNVGVNDLSLGGLVPVPGAADALRAYSGGIMPAPLRAAARHQLRARGLTQARAADRVGVSRPQLVNALRGRFGLGRAPAARLVALLAA